jgi:hypothetical protein
MKNSEMWQSKKYKKITVSILEIGYNTVYIEYFINGISNGLCDEMYKQYFLNNFKQL